MNKTKKPLTQKAADTNSKLSKTVSAHAKKPLSSKKEKKPIMPCECSHDSIALRAYFISERRRELGWDGSEQTDWLEAEKQLLAEAGENS